MKLRSVISALALAAVMTSCGGGAKESKVTSKVNATASETLKGFEQKGAKAFYSGMNYGGKSYKKVLYLIIADYEDIKLNMFSIETPPEGKKAISIAIYGPKGTDMENLTAFKAGKISTDEAEDGSNFTVSIMRKDPEKSWPVAESFLGDKWVTSDKIKGEVEFTEINDDVATGKLTYSVEEGGDMTVEFDCGIEKDLWAEQLETMKKLKDL